MASAARAARAAHPPAGALCYLDNNATTLAPPEVLAAMTRWANRGDPSAAHAGAREARAMMDTFRREIAAACGFELEGGDAYDVVFTSGASESNSQVITGAVRAYAAATGRLPHLITGAAEHPSVLLCAERLAREKACQLTVLPVGRRGPGYGAVASADLDAALRPNTCLVSITAACGETGALSDLRELASLAHRARVPFHTDAAQAFGRAALRPAELGIDAFSVSFHKLHAPPGVGALVLRRRFAAGYDLAPLICGLQNGGARGGGENLPGIAAALVAFRQAVDGRAAKTARARRLRDALRAALAAHLPCFAADAHPADALPSLDGVAPPGPAPRGTEAAQAAIRAAAAGGPPALFWLAPADDSRALPNTLRLAVRRPGFSARAALAALERRGVVVGLGSDALAPAPLRGAVLRVSLSDHTTSEDVKKFVHAFLEVILSGEALAGAAPPEPAL